MKYAIPEEMLKHFSDEAINKHNLNKNSEVFAIALGTKKHDLTEVKELVYPCQNGNSIDFPSLSKYFILFHFLF